MQLSARQRHAGMPRASRELHSGSQRRSASGPPGLAALRCRAAQQGLESLQLALAPAAASAPYSTHSKAKDTCMVTILATSARH